MILWIVAGLLAATAAAVAVLAWWQHQTWQKLVVLQNVLIPWLNGISQHIGDDRPPIPEPPIKG